MWHGTGWYPVILKHMLRLSDLSPPKAQVRSLKLTHDIATQDTRRFMVNYRDELELDLSAILSKTQTNYRKELEPGTKEEIDLDNNDDLEFKNNISELDKVKLITVTGNLESDKIFLGLDKDK